MKFHAKCLEVSYSGKRKKITEKHHLLNDVQENLALPIYKKLQLDIMFRQF